MELGNQLYKWLVERNLEYPMFPFLLTLLILLLYIMMKEQKTRPVT